jgi:hypothetical protein
LPKIQRLQEKTIQKYTFSEKPQNPQNIFCQKPHYLSKGIAG